MKTGCKLIRIVDRLSKLLILLVFGAFKCYSQGISYNSLYNGTLGIQIPFYALQKNTINLPIYLTYNASGHKVETISSNIGLGWNLSTGGSIKRIVRGIPDDYYMNDEANFGAGWIETLDVSFDWVLSNGWFTKRSTIYNYNADMSVSVCDYISG